MDTTNGFLTSGSFRLVLFQLLISGLTPVSLLESEWGFEIVTQFVDTRKDHLHMYSPGVYDRASCMTHRCQVEGERDQEEYSTQREDQVRYQHFDSQTCNKLSERF
jgi:hypothetical protein